MVRGASKKRPKDPAAVALGRKGGLASKKNRTPEERTEIARKAALARWGSSAEGSKKKT